MNYKILRGTDIVDLADAVNANIEKGWRVQGGICFATPGVMDLGADQPHPWIQAMVRDAETVD